MIALFGIAWMADTFIANNEDAIVSALGDLAGNWPFMIAVAIFARRGADDQPIGGDENHGSARARARDRRRLHDRDVDRGPGVLFLPANGTQIAAAEADTTGTTTLGKRVIDHSFQLPLQVAWIVTALVGIAIVWLFFGDHTPPPPVPATREHERPRRGLPRYRRDGRRRHLRAARRGGRGRRGRGLDLVPAGRGRRRAARLHRRQARRALPVLGRPDRVPHRRASATGGWSASRRGSATWRRS